MTDPAQKKRRSRLTRDRKAFPQFEPNERHKQILLLVHKHRFLSTELLWHLLHVDEPPAQAPGDRGADGKRRPKRYGFGQQALYKALQKLFHANYLQRHFLYDEPLGRGLGSHPSIYGLGSKSSHILPDLAGCTSREVQEIVQANKVKAPFLRHALEIARFRVVLELACKRSNGSVRLVFWEQGQRLRDYIHGQDASGNEGRLAVCPDAMFALEVRGKGKAVYMLELDRGTMPIRAKNNRSDIMKKIVAYRTYRRQKRHERRYAYRTLPDGTATGLLVNSAPELSVKPETGVARILGFNVLFVMPGSVGDDGKPSGRIANVLAEMMRMGREFTTTSLFWFTNPEVFSLERPATVFDRIWVTPKLDLGLLSMIE